MKNKLFSSMLIFALLSLVVSSPFVMAQGTQLVLADFNSGDKPNNVGGDFGSWDKDPEDDTQGTQMAFEPDDALANPAGYSIRLDYDVDSANPAYNGFWMKLGGEDARDFNTLTFYIKGDIEKGFTKRVKVELKDQSGKPSPYVVANVTGEWQKVSIPFEKFRRVSDWSRINEFVVVFDDMNSRPKTGSLLIDQVTFSKE
ncbi:MAG: hypothetical protein A2Z83_09060 [Omnitrophica bacterium GWA2_52_8]|nr:MAG: hypothetical protein A2Z83_09060 [Omnitrophica bacterium GWA2_52_8]